jgi:CMP-N-acetylneuraminate monooxygenase
MRLTHVGTFERYDLERNECIVDLAPRAPGVHQTDDALFMLSSARRVEWLVSRTCDHANGKLSLCEDAHTARCPLHGWELDVESLRYRNVGVAKARLPYRQVGEQLVYERATTALRVPADLISPVPRHGTVRFLAHACLAIDVGGQRIVTDPWLIGPCFTTGWWHAAPPKTDAFDVVASADLIFISHNHPDHMHAETLSRLRRDVPIVVPAFATQSVVRPLRAMGFTHVTALAFNELHRVEGSPIVLAILQAGDFRDDSGLFVQAGELSLLASVDSNQLNSFVLPHGVDLLATSFAGGASGFPLCFEVFSEEERFKLSKRNRGAAALQAMRYVEAVAPRVYVPYAGHFTESASRDRFIREHNAKNSSRDIVDAVARSSPEVRAVNLLETDVIHFRGSSIETERVDLPPMYVVDDSYVQRYIAQAKREAFDFDARVVRDYFAESGFRDDLLLMIVPTDDQFVPVDEHQAVRVDFGGEGIAATIHSGGELLREFEVAEPEGRRIELIKARVDSLWSVITKRLPLEDLSIGFQARIDRKPNVYSSQFWYHFTNVYIGGSR